LITLTTTVARPMAPHANVLFFPLNYLKLRIHQQQSQCNWLWGLKNRNNEVWVLHCKCQVSIQRWQ